jgi:hypothetical protein
VKFKTATSSGKVMLPAFSDNAKPPHTNKRTTAEIHRLGFTVLDHPTYSPDRVPYDFHLFPKTKEHLRGYHFLSDGEVKPEVKMWFHQQDAQFYRDGHIKLPECCWKCVDRRDDYTEK